MLISVAVNTKVVVVVPSVKVILSPTATLVLSKAACTAKVVLPLSSAVLTTPSLLVSVMMVTVGASPALGELLSMVRSFLTGLMMLPATSVMAACKLYVPLGMVLLVLFKDQVPLLSTLV